MFFTQEDYKKIQQWLIKNSVKDTELNEANIPFNGNEIVSIVQGTQNKRVLLKDLVSQIFNLGVSDFVNITDKYDAPNISLEEAIRLIPSRARKEGQVVTFLDKENHWHIYQFKGVLNQWNVLDQWEDLFDWEKIIIDSILPDEEDLTKSLPDDNGNSYLSLKDREYNPEDFSGLGRVILRKNIVEIEDPIYGKVKKNVLYQNMFTQSNTVYECRYDFDLNGQDIILPNNSYIEYKGGSISNGTILDAAKGINRIVLKKNIINGKNILTQDIINKENTIYEIRYDFTLENNVTIPVNCILEFNGGSVNNGVLLLNSGVKLIGHNTVCTNLLIKYVSHLSNVLIAGIEFVGYKNLSADGWTYCISTSNYYNINNLIIKDCKIHGYNSGISVGGSNISIIDNLLYDNGSTESVVIDALCDIAIEGQFTTEITYNNIIISRNRCLSKDVMRNIDSGENYFVNNIIITDNICISSNNNFSECEITDTYRKVHCIMVGYVGSSEKEKIAIIANNICKGGRRSGIYIRANNSDSTGTGFYNKYKVNIHGNIIENIGNTKEQALIGGIACEIGTDSIISNNIIKNVIRGDNEGSKAVGISVGFVFKDSEVLVANNTISYCDYGVANDSFGRKLHICSNHVNNCSKGIDLSEAGGASIKDFENTIVVNNNVLFNNTTSGILIFHVYADTIEVYGNTIYGGSKETSIGIDISMIKQNYVEIYSYNIHHNSVTNCKIGINTDAFYGTSLLRNVSESTKQLVNYNILKECTQAIQVESMIKSLLFVVEGNQYINCDSMFGNQNWAVSVYNGKIHHDNTVTIFDDRNYGPVGYGDYHDNPVVIFYNVKKFLKGDKVVSNDGTYFIEATCTADYEGNYPNFVAKPWKLVGGVLSTKVINKNLCTIEGQTVYDITRKKNITYNGTTWVDATGVEV